MNDALTQLRTSAALRALVVFVAVMVVGAVSLSGFTSRTSLNSMLVLASFLGIAAVGQSLTALVGSIDLSIPYVIGMANVGLAHLLGKGTSLVVAVGAVVLAAALVGFVNGWLTDTFELPPLILTLATGLAVSGGVQVWTRGNVNGGAPDWLVDVTGISNTTFGVPIPPLVVVWLVLSLGVVFVLRYTSAGRRVYALGNNRTAADRAHINVSRTWICLYVVSAVFAALAGMLLLGFTTGGFVDVGKPYLFSTVAAVVLGGTSLLGGKGGYGLTVIGALGLTALTTILLGFGLSTAAQQAVLGAVILGMVCLYGRTTAVYNRI